MPDYICKQQAAEARPPGDLTLAWAGHRLLEFDYGSGTVQRTSQDKSVRRKKKYIPGLSSKGTNDLLLFACPSSPAILTSSSSGFRLDR